VHSPEYEKFVYHTPESFNAVLAELKTLSDSGRRGQLKTREREVGIKFDPHCVLWVLDIRAMLRPPYCMYPDWMHTFVASGGLAAHELNGLAQHLEDKFQIDAKHIDDWCEGVTLPKAWQRMPKEFFQRRVVRGNPDGHVKAFASEVLTAITLLGFFVDCFIKAIADEETQMYVHCFELLRALIVILQRQNLDYLEAARNAMQLHHALYNQLYYKKPKLCQQPLILEYWKFWKRLVNCFGAERHHKLMKRVGGFSYRNSAMTTLAYDVRTWMQHLDDPTLYQAFHLSGTVRPLVTQVWISAFDTITFEAWAASLNTPMGLLSKGDMLQFSTDSAEYVGLAAGFGRLAATGEHVAFVTAMELQNGIWRIVSHGTISIVPERAIVGAVPCFKHGDGYLALLIARA